MFWNKKKKEEQAKASREAELLLEEQRQQAYRKAEKDIQGGLIKQEINLDLAKEEFNKAREELVRAANKGTERDIDEAKRHYHYAKQHLERLQRSYEKAKAIVRVRNEDQAIAEFENQIVSAIKEQERNAAPKASKAEVNAVYEESLNQSVDNMREENLVDETYQRKMNELEEAHQEAKDIRAPYPDEETDEIIARARMGVETEKEKKTFTEDYEEIRENLEKRLSEDN